VRKILDDAAFREKFLAPQMFEPMGSSPEAFAQFVRSETQRWGKVIRDANLKID
jgi:tripartite-type tricarboxylate transporter receptor subunit TctC